MSHVEELINKWWKPFTGEERPKLTKSIRNKKIVDALLNAADLLTVSSSEVKALMKLMLPMKASTPEDISFFDNYNKYILGEVRHRTKTSPGKFFRKIFPTATDPLVEAFAAFYSNNIEFNSSDYILHVGDTKEDFKNAFTKYYNCRGNLDYSYAVSISDSCMRYDFDSLSDHPSVVYASGDFKVIAVRTKAGKTRARAVVGYKDGAYSLNRIYGSCNHSVSMILDFLKDKPTFDQWFGLKLLKVTAIARDRNSFLCPYIDQYRYVSIYDADHLIIDAEYHEASNGTSGYVYWGNAEIESYWAVNRENFTKKLKL